MLHRTVRGLVAFTGIRMGFKTDEALRSYTDRRTNGQSDHGPCRKRGGTGDQQPELAARYSVKMQVNINAGFVRIGN
jgi:hypothetical protein